ncbi:hypothetical protein ACFX12_028591 [Malus domestica]
MDRNPPHARPNNTHSNLPSSINLTTFTFSQLFLLPGLISANGESVVESGNEFHEIYGVVLIAGLISAGAEFVVESAEEFLDDLSDNLAKCIGTIWSCPDLHATVIPGLISANAESAEDFTVDLSDNSSKCIGTSLVSVLLLDMVLMASDCRISALVFLNAMPDKGWLPGLNWNYISVTSQGQGANTIMRIRAGEVSAKPTNLRVIAEKPFQFPFRHPCELCNVFGPWRHSCSYLECIPDSVIQVPNGYEICYKRGVRNAEMIDCVLCGKFGDHVSKNRPERSKFMAIIDPVIGLSPPTPSSC